MYSHALRINDTMTEWNGRSFRDENGIMHPANIITIWTEAKRKAVGLYPIIETDIPSDKVSTGWALEYDPETDTVTRVHTLADKPVYVPQEASRRQILTALGIKGWITMEEAEAALATGAKPAAVLAVVNSLPEEERFPARMKWAGFQHAYRTDPIVLALAQVEGKTDAEIDELFILAASID